MGRGYGVSRSPKVRPSMELVKKLRETETGKNLEPGKEGGGKAG